VGYGLAGEAFHAPFLATTPGLSLETIVTGDPSRRARAARRWPAARLLATADQLWSLGGEHDLVVVAAANRAHVPLARAAIDAGLAVVVDKPLAPSADEAADLVAYAATKAVPLTVYQNRRWDAELLTLRGLLEIGALGDVWRFESRFERWRPAVPNRWRESADPADGGGLLLDLGTHLVDQALELLGPATLLHAEVRRRRPGAAVDDDTFLVLAHDRDAVSHLWMSATAAHLGPRLRVLGSRAAFVADHLDGQEDTLRAGVLPTEPGYGREPPSRWGRLVQGDRVTPVPSQPGAYQRFYIELERALRTAGPLPVDPASAVAVLRLLDEARRRVAPGDAIS
jgi:predicted dehydrogenase